MSDNNLKTHNKRGYLRTPAGQKVSRSLEEINQSLATRERPEVTQEDLDRMNKKRHPVRIGGTIFILRNGAKQAERISREVGHALIQSGQAEPVSRRAIKDALVPVNADEQKRRKEAAETEKRKREERIEAERLAKIDAERKAKADAKAKERAEKREAEGGKKKQKKQKRR